MRNTMGRAKRDYATEVAHVLDEAATKAAGLPAHRDPRGAAATVAALGTQTKGMLADAVIPDARVLSYAKWAVRKVVPRTGRYIRDVALAAVGFVLSPGAETDMMRTKTGGYSPELANDLGDAAALLLRDFGHAQVDSGLALLFALAPSPDDADAGAGLGRFLRGLPGAPDDAGSDADANTETAVDATGSRWLWSLEGDDRELLASALRSPWSGLAIEGARADAAATPRGGRSAAMLAILRDRIAAAAVSKGMADMPSSWFYSVLKSPADLDNVFTAMAPMTDADAAAINFGDIDDAMDTSEWHIADIFSDGPLTMDGPYVRPAGWRRRVRSVAVRLHAAQRDESHACDLGGALLRSRYLGTDGVRALLTAAPSELKSVARPLLAELKESGYAAPMTPILEYSLSEALKEQGDDPDSDEVVRLKTMLRRCYRVGAYQTADSPLPLFPWSLGRADSPDRVPDDIG